MIDRAGLMRTALVVYLGLTAAALLIAWIAGVDLRPLLRFELWQFAIGVAAVVPMSIVFFVAPDLKDHVVDLLGRTLAECRLFDLVLLAAMAGIAEELVFRGALEGWLRHYELVAAIVITNLLFGAMHPITVGYFLMAAGFGVYFSLLATLGPERNLTAPITAHAVYDFLGFLLVARDYRKTQVTTTIDRVASPGSLLPTQAATTSVEAGSVDNGVRQSPAPPDCPPSLPSPETPPPPSATPT